jgi:hypothetical protein
MAFTSHQSRRASASPADAVQALDNNNSDTHLALDGIQALRLMIIATYGTENPGESLPWAPFYLASGQPALPVGDSPVLATRLPEEEAGNVSSLWVHFSAIPLPPDHGLPLGFVASPLAMTSARAFITELEAWSHLKDHCWDWMDNPFFDACFSAQARDPRHQERHEKCKLNLLAGLTILKKDTCLGILSACRVDSLVAFRLRNAADYRLPTFGPHGNNFGHS